MWAYGIVLVEVFTRTVPWPDLDDQQVSFYQGRGEITFPTIPDNVAAIPILQGLYPTLFHSQPMKRPTFSSICSSFKTLRPQYVPQVFTPEELAQKYPKIVDTRTRLTDQFWRSSALQIISPGPKKVLKIIDRGRTQIWKEFPLNNEALALTHRCLSTQVSLKPRKVLLQRKRAYLQFPYHTNFRKRVKNYQPIEIRNLLINVLHSLAEFQKNEGVHANIKPENIFFVNDRITFTDSYPSKMFAQFITQTKYTAPEFAQFLQKNDDQNNENQQQNRSNTKMFSNQGQMYLDFSADIFSIGVIALEFLAQEASVDKDFQDLEKLRPLCVSRPVASCEYCGFSHGRTPFHCRECEADVYSCKHLAEQTPLECPYLYEFLNIALKSDPNERVIKNVHLSAEECLRLPLFTYKLEISDPSHEVNSPSVKIL